VNSVDSCCAAALTVTYMEPAVTTAAKDSMTNVEMKRRVFIQRVPLEIARPAEEVWHIQPILRHLIIVAENSE